LSGAALNPRGVVAAIALVSAGCVPPHEMMPFPPVTRSCPDAAVRVTPVRWFFPVVDSDNRTMDRWCRTLGPVVLDSLPAGDFGVPGPDDSLTVAVWNANAGAGELVEFVRRELSLTCAGRSSARPDGAAHFVLLVQEALRRSDAIPDGPRLGLVAPPASEAPRPGPRLDVVAVAHRCGLSVFYAPQVRNGFAPRDGLREDRGVAILSTLPLTDFALIELPLEAARRVVAVASVRNGDGARLRLASVHLITTPPPWRVLVTGNSSRVRQALGLADALRQMDAAPGSAVSTLAAGDLNTWSVREGAIRRLRELFPDSPHPLATPTRGPFPTDHVFFRRAPGRPPGADRILPGSYRRVENTYSSDHHPVIVRFSF
jgi:endonuclease/exonuclease/phosphatase family metal-dependent hydrolase